MKVFPRICLCFLSVSAGLASVVPARAGTIFEDSFDKISGGERTILERDSQVKVSIQGEPKWDGGPHLNFSVGEGETGNALNFLAIVPEETRNSWAAMAGSVSVGGVNYFTLNGAFEIFVRVNEVPSATDLAWFRPVDIDSRNGSNGLRLVFTGNAGSAIQVEIAGAAGALAFGTTPGDFTKDSVYVPIHKATEILQPGTSAHIAFTFHTDKNTGEITAQVLLSPETGPLSADSAAASGILRFYASADVLGGTLLDGRWILSARAPESGDGWMKTSVDYDTIRLYDSAPETFPGLK